VNHDYLSTCFSGDTCAQYIDEFNKANDAGATQVSGCH
jgi:hypothetical protein